MRWSHFLIAVAMASVASSFTDWLFMGVLFHKKYLEIPEIWRPLSGSGERNRIVTSQLIGSLSCAAFAYLCALSHADSMSAALSLAALAWISGPVVVIAQMVQWTKLHPVLGVSHSLGWLVRLAITGALVAWLL